MSFEMLYFAISLKSKRHSEDWELTLSNLKRTLTSIKKSSAQNYHIYIATNDPQEVSSIIDPSKTTLVRAHFELPNTPARRGALDKEKKRRLIGAYLRNTDQHEPSGFYLMFLDADDLVHRELVNYVSKDDNKRGYIVDKGYEIDVAKSLISPNLRFHSTCGSCYIGYFSKEDLPETENDVECYFSNFKRHGDFYYVAYEKNRTPDKIPFFAVVYYTNHNDSLSYGRESKKIKRAKFKKTKFLLKELTKKMFYFRRCNSAKEKYLRLMREYFNLDVAPTINFFSLAVPPDGQLSQPDSQ